MPTLALPRAGFVSSPSAFIVPPPSKLSPLKKALIVWTTALPSDFDGPPIFFDRNNFINIASNMRDIIKGGTVKNS